MKSRFISQWVLSGVLSLGLFLTQRSFGQGGPPPLPVLPGFLLDYWQFDDTNWLSGYDTAPRSFTNLDNVPSWDGNALQVDSPDPAWLQYDTEVDGWPELACDRGTVRFWFKPNWAGTNLGGTGPGTWGRLIEAGAYTTNASYGWWSLYLDADGANLYFSAQTNGASANYLTAPISWDADTWHQIALTYSASNSALYLDGQLATNGPGVTYWPGAEVLTNGFFIGSDNTGLAQGHGMFEDMDTWDYPLAAETISNDYAALLPEVPVPQGSLFGGLTMSTGSILTPPDGGDGGTDDGSGGGSATNWPGIDWTVPLTNLVLVAPEDVPDGGTFFLYQDALTNAPPPPYPFDPFPQCPVYSLGVDGCFLVDDTGMDRPVISDFSYSIRSYALPAPIYSATDLWLEITNVSNGYANLILHGTQAGVNYEIVSKPALAASSWSSAGVISGSPDTNWTAVSVPTGNARSLFFLARINTNFWLEILHPGTNAITSDTNAVAFILHGAQPDTAYDILSKQTLADANWTVEMTLLGVAGQASISNAISRGGRATLFLWARNASLDSDGSGLPDWWQLKYFGHLEVDPLADPDGDGWNNWQEFKNGTNPTNFDTPPLPQGLVSTLDPANSYVTLDWLPASGAVTGYTIGRYDDLTSQWTYYTVGVTNRFVDTNYPAYAPTDYHYLRPSVYKVQADYTAGASGWNYGANPYSTTDVPFVFEMPAAGGTTALLVTHIPPGASALRLTRTDITNNNETPYSHLEPVTSMDFPISAFTNTFTIPTNMVFTGPFGSIYNLEVLWPDGSQSAPVSAGTPQMNFYDGRVQLEQNVSFLLRAASLTNSFSYVFPHNNSAWYQVNQPTEYTYASLYDADPNTGSGLGDEAWQNWQRPFDDNYRYCNFLYLSGTSLDASGFLNTGCAVDGAGNYSLQFNRVFQFAVPTSSATIPALAQSTFMQPYTDYQLLGMYLNEASQLVLPNDIYNYFGLHLSSVLIAHSHEGTLYLDTLSAGATWPATNDTCYFYPQFDQPQLQTIGYYFGRMNDQWTYAYPNTIPADTLPGSSNFSPTNAPPPLIVGMGGYPIQIAAFAVETVLNGDTTKPVYVAQYFDKAFKVDINGNVTSTETGVLSPWGDFLPTEPGPVALVTMPDSMGNTVMMEALKELAASSQAPLDNYVMMQAAVPAQCYDSTVTNLPLFMNQEQLIPTPNTYAGYAAGITNALRVGGKLINFFNTNDFALATGTTNVSIPVGFGISIGTKVGICWQDNEALSKPLVFFGYSYNPTNSTAYLTNVSEGVTGRTVTDPFEQMPFVARPRTKAVGAQGGVEQVVNGGELDLPSLGFTREAYDHSGQFNRNIQTPQVQSFYPQLKTKLFPPQ